MAPWLAKCKILASDYGALLSALSVTLKLQSKSKCQNYSHRYDLEIVALKSRFLDVKAALVCGLYTSFICDFDNEI